MNSPRLPPAVLLAAGVAAAAFAVFAPALGNGFVWDDEIVVERQLPLYDSLASPFLPAVNVPQSSPFYFRPVVILSYLLDQAAGGGAAWAFHLSPVLLHVLASVLVFALLRQLLTTPKLQSTPYLRSKPGWGSELPATLAALLFALHPVHAEVVAWMTGRAESLAAIGVLGALLAWSRWLEAGRVAWLVAGSAALLFGLLGKETALAGALLAAGLPALGSESARDRRRQLLLAVAVAGCLALYFTLRAVALRGVASGLPVELALAERLQLLLGAIAFYGHGLLLGGSPGGVRTFVPTGTGQLATGAIGVAAGVLGLGLALRARARLALWALAWIVLGLALPLLLVQRAISETPIADRYLYLPSVGLALLVGWGLAQLRGRRRQAAVSVTAVIVLAAGIASARASRLWHDDLRFWRNAVAIAPADGFPQLKLGVELRNRGALAEAEAAYRQALTRRLTPAQRSITENNLGWLLLQAGRCPEAEPLFRASITLQPRISGPYRGLVECIWPRGRDPEARPEIRALLERSLEVEPGQARSALLLGHLHQAEGETERAIHWFRYATRVAPGTATAERAAAALAGLSAR